MNDFPQTHLNSPEQEPNSDSEMAELAASSLSRALENQDAPEDDGESDNYDDADDYDYYGEERTDFDEEKLTLQEIPLPQEILDRYPFLSKLPHGVAVMGGVARSIAREIITGDREPIRDIDLVNILDENGDSAVDAETLDALSQRYMFDDYSFGHGIEDDTLENYFQTRDFTINQSLIMDGKLIISDFAYNDFQENIIRPTYFEHPHNQAFKNDRLFLKALMLRSVLSQVTSSIPLIEDIYIDDPHIEPFNIALFLNKSMSRDAETARIFTEDLADWDVIDTRYAGRPVALAKVLLSHVYSFEFRPSTDGQFQDILGCEDLNGFFIPRAMTEYSASDPVIRQAIAEYKDNPIGSHNGEERITGRYTQDEYDKINRSPVEDEYFDYSLYGY